MKAFLIKFSRYFGAKDKTILVYAENFDAACEKIKTSQKFKDQEFWYFRNLTLE